MNENKQTIRRLFELLNANDPDGIGELIDDDVVIHTPVPGVECGRAGFLNFVGLYLAAFPEQPVDVNDLLAEGDLVVARHPHGITRGGDFVRLSPGRTEGRFRGIEQFRLRDGRIVEFWYQDDLFGLLR